MRIGLNQIETLSATYNRSVVSRCIDRFAPGLSRDERARCLDDALKTLAEPLSFGEISDSEIARQTLRFVEWWLETHAAGAALVRPTH